MIGDWSNWRCVVDVAGQCVGAPHIEWDEGGIERVGCKWERASLHNVLDSACPMRGVRGRIKCI